MHVAFCLGLIVGKGERSEIIPTLARLDYLHPFLHETYDQSPAVSRYYIIGFHLLFFFLLLSSHLLVLCWKEKKKRKYDADCKNSEQISSVIWKVQVPQVTEEDGWVVVDRHIEKIDSDGHW